MKEDQALQGNLLSLDYIIEWNCIIIVRRVMDAIVSRASARLFAGPSTTHLVMVAAMLIDAYQSVCPEVSWREKRMKIIKILA